MKRYNIGDKFGQYEVIAVKQRACNSEIDYTVRCECGRTEIVKARALIKKNECEHTEDKLHPAMRDCPCNKCRTAQEIGADRCRRYRSCKEWREWLGRHFKSSAAIVKAGLEAKEEGKGGRQQ